MTDSAETTHTTQTKMRPIRDTIPLDTALALILEAARPVKRTTRVGLIDSHRRVLSFPITASQDVPPFNRAAMDGFAVIAEDTFGASRQTPRSLAPCRNRAHGERANQASVSGRVHGDSDRRADA